MIQSGIYQRRLSKEKEQFKDNINVHDLPLITQYWAEKFLMPMRNEFGITGIDQFFAKYFLESANKSSSESYSFISIGSGNADAEIRIAALLLQSGLQNFTIECLELNENMMQRGIDAAEVQGLGEYIKFVQGDFNQWEPDGRYTGIMANQSLHHVTNLEKLFDGIKRGLEPTSYFLTSDMIGRNGHQVWPEAQALIDEFWQKLPPKYRYNNILKRHEETYQNFDCSSEGFEGIRAQDILPLLVERFDFHLFIGFASIIAPFKSRFFGRNFDPAKEWDCFFIDWVHAVDEVALLSGLVTPTQMLAVMTPEACEHHHFSRGLSPKLCIRKSE